MMVIMALLEMRGDVDDDSKGQDDDHAPNDFHLLLLTKVPRLVRSTSAPSSSSSL